MIAASEQPWPADDVIEETERLFGVFVEELIFTEQVSCSDCAREKGIPLCDLCGLPFYNRDEHPRCFGCQLDPMRWHKRLLELLLKRSKNSVTLDLCA